MTFFSEKISTFTAKISDDLFVIDLVFRIFPFFSQISVPLTRFNVVYDPFLTRTTTISEKNSFMTPFLLCSSFRAHPTTLLLKILGGRMHGPSPPPQILGGPSPQFPLGLRPCMYVCCMHSSLHHRHRQESISEPINQFVLSSTNRTFMT